jgi:hypothetical protein
VLSKKIISNENRDGVTEAVTRVIGAARFTSDFSDLGHHPKAADSHFLSLFGLIIA